MLGHIYIHVVYMCMHAYVDEGRQALYLSIDLSICIHVGYTYIHTYIRIHTWSLKATRASELQRMASVPWLMPCSCLIASAMYERVSYDT